MARSIIKLRYTLCCIVLTVAAVAYSQNFKEIDSLQQVADSLGRAGLNRKAAFEQNYVDARLINSKPGVRSDSYYRLAAAYIRSREYDDAFYYIVLALGEYQKLKDNIGIANCYGVMGQVYLYKKDYNKAEYYNRRALSLFNNNPHRKGAAATAKVLYADFFIDRKNYAAAVKLLMDALNESPGNGFYNSQDYIRDKIGLCCAMQRKFAEAERCYLDVIAAGERHSYIDIRMSVRRHLGELYILKKDYDKAQAWLEKALELRPEAEDSEEFMLANKSMAKLYEAQENYSKAYFYQMEGVTASREIMDAATLVNTDATSTKFDAEQLALENKLLESEAETKRIAAEQADSRKNVFLLLFLFAILVAFTVLVFVYLYFRQRKAAALNRNNELRQQLLLTQMNPHFIFNSVDNIQSLIYEDRNEEAIDYLSKFSGLTLQIVENSSQQYITLHEEVSMTANYLVIQQLLYNNFEFRVHVDEAIDAKTMLIPPMLTQPFIENAIKHGIAGKKSGGQITVQFSKKGRHLYFEVSDNGKGLTGQGREGHRSMATKITTERLARNRGHRAIEVTNIIEGGVVKGAVSRLLIPYKIKR